MTGNEAIDYIHSMVWNRKATGYEHAKALLTKMGNPEKQLKYIHIGGTNGKGSTAAMLASVLQEAGYKTGLYTSPYIYRFHERMQINGEPISDADLGQITEYVKSFADEMEDCPSEFALVCCIAFEYFARKKCDIVVLEVGMGGETDSTNVIECPEVAILTNIGLDHTEYLGNTLEEIAATKAKIFKEGGTAVVYRSTPSVEQIYRDVCQDKKVKLQFADFDSIQLIRASLEGQDFSFENRKDLFIPLLGEHQLYNAAVAITAVDALRQQGWDVKEEDLRLGLSKTRWPGRFEVVGQKPLFVIDGGHNPQCIEALARNVEVYLKEQKVIAVAGVLADKDYESMFRPILPLVDEFVCITPPCPRALAGEELALYLKNHGGRAVSCNGMEESLRYAVQAAGEEGAILCFGSLYSIGEIQKTLKVLGLL